MLFVVELGIALIIATLPDVCVVDAQVSILLAVLISIERIHYRASFGQN